MLTESAPEAHSSATDKNDDEVPRTEDSDEEFFNQRTKFLQQYEARLKSEEASKKYSAKPSIIGRTASQMETFLEKIHNDETIEFKNLMLDNIRDNRERLYEEIEFTINQFEKFIENMEEYANTRKNRKVSSSKADWMSRWRQEKAYQESLKNGIQSMTKFVRAITMEPHAIELKDFLWRFKEDEPGKRYYKDDKILDLQMNGYTLVVRYARLLEQEGIEHDLPVPPPLKRQHSKFMEISRPTVEIESEANFIIEDQSKNDNSSENDQTETTLSPSVSSLIGMNDDITPARFIKMYAEQNDLTLHYNEVSFKTSPFKQEAIMACRMHTIGAEGKGKNRSIAKEAASAALLKILLNRLKKGIKLEGLGPLTEDDQKLALELTCEYINYEDILNNKISKFNTSRMPQYYPVFNTPNGLYSFRCKALGFNGVGTGKNKEVAKRMGAKLVIDQIEQQREKYLINKYGEKRAKKLLKLN